MAEISVFVYSVAFKIGQKLNWLCTQDSVIWNSYIDIDFNTSYEIKPNNINGSTHLTSNEVIIVTNKIFRRIETDKKKTLLKTK